VKLNNIADMIFVIGQLKLSSNIKKTGYKSQVFVNSWTDHF